jgi:hypothetical protein
LGQLLPAAAVPMGIVIDCDLGRQRGMLGCFFAAFNSEISQALSIKKLAAETQPRYRVLPECR